MQLVRVALPVPLFRLFDYLLPQANTPLATHTNSNALLGCRVCVPFGNKQLVGVVVDLPSSSDVPANKLKPIHSLLDDTPLLSTQLMQLAHWLSNYYIYPLGDTFSVMLPRLLKQGNALPTLKPHWCITPESLAHTFPKQAKKQAAQYSLIAQHGSAGCDEATLLTQGVSRTFLKKLHKKKLIRQFFAAPTPSTATLAEVPLALNPYQKQAHAQILAHKGFAGFLLFGVTGSGKTEVYLQLIQQTLKAGKQALVLVPEIGLTPQTLGRFRTRFQANIVTLHSRMNETQRLESWSQLASGLAHIIIGTRSAVLAPFAHLGLIIVDEEHDGSYKQQTTLRYHARDVALYRGQQENCPVVLGSATPSLESLQRVQVGKLTQLTLPHRAGMAKTASMKIIDVRGKYTQSSMSDTALAAIRHTLQKDEQVLVFLNRRGYAPALVCSACGWTADCPRCDARLTLHYQPYHYLKCHHCDWQCYKPKSCQDCGSANILPIGTGTAKLEELLAEHFPAYPLFRIDADTTRRKNSWADLYQQIHTNKAAILLGTQMLAKGHHFPNVTLVVMPNVDNGMISSDFRAPERVAQLMIQVAGRAGRGDKQGTVLIQSLQPNNPMLLQLVRKGYADFAHTAMQERQKLLLPPFRFSALVRVEGKTAAKNHEFLQAARQLLESMANQQAQASKGKPQKMILWGPLAAPMQRKADRFHTHLYILSNHRKQLHQLLSDWWLQALALPQKNATKVTLDIDPIEF